MLVALVLAGCDGVFGLVRVADPEPDASTTCPGDYVAMSTGRYRLAVSTASWNMAELDCRDDRVDSSDRYTHLVVLSSDAERDVAVTLASTHPAEDRFWIGLTDSTIEGDFHWVTTEDSPMSPRYVPPWLAGEPDDGAMDQDCVSIENLSLLHDHRCVALDRAYVCECDAFQ